MPLPKLACLARKLRKLLAIENFPFFASAHCIAGRQAGRRAPSIFLFFSPLPSRKLPALPKLHKSDEGERGERDESPVARRKAKERNGAGR